MKIQIIKEKSRGRDILGDGPKGERKRLCDLTLIVMRKQTKKRRERALGVFSKNIRVAFEWKWKKKKIG